MTRIAPASTPGGVVRGMDVQAFYDLVAGRRSSAWTAQGVLESVPEVAVLADEDDRMRLCWRRGGTRAWSGGGVR